MALKTFNVDHEVYQKFSEHCKREGISMSKRIENFLKAEVDRIQMDKSGSLFGHPQQTVHAHTIHNVRHSNHEKPAKPNKKTNAAKRELVVAIVGSHVDSVTAISNYLEARKMRTCWAYIGTEAIALCRMNNARILVMDSTMAGMGAFEVAKLFPEQKMIVITALDDVDQLASQFRNIVGVVKKPVDYEELENLIKKKA